MDLIVLLKLIQAKLKFKSGGQSPPEIKVRDLGPCGPSGSATYGLSTACFTQMLFHKFANRNVWECSVINNKIPVNERKVTANTAWNCSIFLYGRNCFVLGLLFTLQSFSRIKQRGSEMLVTHL